MPDRSNHSTRTSPAEVFAHSVSDDTLFGYFPQFRGSVTKDDAFRVVELVESVTREQIRRIIGRLPDEWLSGNARREAMEDFVYQRARRIRRVIELNVHAQNLFDAMPLPVVEAS